MAAGRLNLGDFLTALGERLAALSHAELKRLVLAHARGVPPDERHEFLALFEPPEPVAPRTDLMAAIEDLSTRLADGEFFDGWEHTDHWGEMEASGDDSWAEELDDLFAAAGGLFVDGRLTEAAEAYTALFTIFDLGEEGETFTGSESPVDMLRTEVHEAWHRFLHAVAATAPAAERVEHVAETIAAHGHWGGEFHVADLLGAGTSPLSGADDFLDEWIEHCRRRLPRRANPWSYDTAERWLTEAVLLRRGVDGLGEQAGELGGDYPPLLHNWIDALRDAGRSADAVDAARLAITKLEGVHRALAADALAGAAAELGDAETEREGRLTAWRAEPTLTRLCALGAGLDAGAVHELASAELELVVGGSYTPAGRPRWALELLAGQVEPVVAALRRAKALGWSQADHPGLLVLPFCLIAHAGGQPEAPSALTSLLEAADVAARAWEGPNQRQGPTDLGRLLAEAAAWQAGDQTAEWFETAVLAVRKRTEAIVGNGHRGAYERAAVAVAAVAEVHVLRGSELVGYDYLQEMRAAFPRHRAFHGELDMVITRSSLLPSNLCRGRRR